MGFKGISLAWLCAIASAHAYASEAAEFTPGGFYSAEELPWRPAQFAAVRAATLQLGSNCSAVGLSRDGYVATALHCVEDCFRPAWDYAPAIAQNLFERDGYYRARAVFERSAPSFRCPAHIARTFSPSGLSTDLFDLVWVGRGLQEHANEKIAELSEQEFSELADLTEDVVILKFHPGPDQGSFPCLPVASRDAEPGSRLWSVGFPGRNLRPGGLGADGVHQFFSPGIVRKNVNEDPVLSAAFAGLPSAARELAWARERRLWNQPHLLLASVDAVGGNSGGLMVDEEGRFAGLLFTTMKSSFDRYDGSTVVGVRAGYLKERVASSLGADAAEEIFACADSGEVAFPAH